MYTVTIYDVRNNQPVLKHICQSIDEACDTRQAMIDANLFSIPVGGMVEKAA